MAAGLNRVSLIGNLGTDPEIRQTPSGLSIANLRIGVTERRKEGDNYKDQTEWVSVVLFGKTAENAGKYLQKGRQVFVEGRLQTRSWEDKTGQKRYTTEVMANQVIFLGNNSASQSSSSSSSISSMDNDFINEDEIPF